MTPKDIRETHDSRAQLRTFLLLYKTGGMVLVEKDTTKYTAYDGEESQGNGAGDANLLTP